MYKCQKIEILQIFNIHKFSMYYKIFTNPHPPPALSPTVMAFYASCDSMRRSCVTRGMEVIGTAMVQPARTPNHVRGRTSPPPPNERPEEEIRLGPRRQQVKSLQPIPV